MLTPALVLAVVCALSTQPASAAKKRWFLPCALESGPVVLKSKPKRCSNLGPGAGFSNANGWIFAKLRWSRWGGSSASGRGVSIPIHRYPGDRPRPMRVTAFSPSRGCGAESPYYTRLRVFYRRWTTRVRPAGGGPARTITLPARTNVVRAHPPTSCW